MENVDEGEKGQSRQNRQKERKERLARENHGVYSPQRPISPILLCPPSGS